MNRPRRFSASAQYTTLAMTLLLWGGVALTAPSAQAAPCPPTSSCQTWCPGQPNPAGRPVPWDTNVCHNFYWDSYGVHDTDNGILYKWSNMGW
jgi:hypothetical protein